MATPQALTPEQIAQIVAAGQGGSVNLGGTIYQPQFTQLGGGEGGSLGPLESIYGYTPEQNKVSGAYNQYDPTGAYTRTGTQQKVSNSLTPFILGSAALFGGIGGGFDGLFGGTSAADAAAAAADADIAGGLIPEFGTNAAYNGFMAGAMTPEAIAAMDALVAAHPEIIGSGALLTDAAAGLTPAGLTPTGGPTNVVTTPPSSITPTPATTSTVTPTTPTVPSVLPADLTKYLTPSVIASLGGLLGGTVLSKATSGGSSATPISVPTQGVPLNSQDYFNAIQQNYNQIMPNVPRDVATPLAAWYNSRYGA